MLSSRDKKILWKIEELWNKNYSPIFKVNFPTEKITALYEQGVSRYNPHFHFVEEFVFRSSQNPVHSDAYGEYFGLEKSQLLKKNGKFIYLFDNHNKIIQPFLEYAEITGKGFDVVHIDAHDDDAVFAKQKPHHPSLQEVQNYIAQTRISDFFDFLSLAFLRGEKHIPLIKNIYRYTKSSDFQEFKKPKESYLLSLDIDIFGPEGDFVDLESKIKIIAKAWRDAEVICIATSPGFINQDFAHYIINILLQRN